MEELPARCLRTRDVQHDITPLSQQQFRCSTCTNKLPAHKFVQGAGTDKNNDYLKYVIQPGKLRCCLHCRADSDERTKCSQCGINKSQEAYSTSMWLHRLKRAPKCLVCIGRQPQAGTQCTLCKKWQPQSSFPESQWHNRVTRAPKCLSCIARQPQADTQCTLCEKWQPQSSFPESQ